jgi:hypothetical protein
MIYGSRIIHFSKWQRKTFDILLGNTVGEISALKERYLIKDAIQSEYNMMKELSYYYKGEEQDIARAQLWRKYAIKMGAVDHPSYWPDYPPLDEDNKK